MRKIDAVNGGRFPTFVAQMSLVRSRSTGPASWSAPQFFRRTKKIMGAAPPAVTRG